MDNRYYNQNPQVTALLEKIEEQERKIKEFEKYLGQLENMLSFSSDKRVNLEVQISKYLRSPWYKRMNFKFEL